MRLMSASIAATAVITATRAALKPRIARRRDPGDPFAGFESLVDECSRERTREVSDPEHNRQASDLIFRCSLLADQGFLRAR